MEGKGSQRNDCEVVIVGSGIGGLTAGAYLAKYGIRVVICEQHRRPGGYFTSFKRKGYTIDPGIQGCEDSGLLLPMFRQLDLTHRIEMRPSRVAFVLPDLFCRLEHYSDLGCYYDHFKDVFPQETQALDRVKKEALELCRVMDAFMHFPNAMFVPVKEMLSEMPGWLMKHGLSMKGLIRFSRLLNTPIEDYLGTFIKDKRLIRLLSVGYRGNPAAFSMTFLYSMMDYYYPARGGVQAIPDLLARVITENGGEIRCKTLVERIIVENGRAVGVELKGGEVIRSRFVINNGDLRRTFSGVVPREAVPEEYRRRVCEQSSVGESVFSVYLGLDIPPEELPTQGCPHVFLMPTYDPPDLGEIDTNPDFYRKALIMISLPSLHDQSLAPPGKSVAILQSPASIRSLDQWGTSKGKRTKKYHALKKEIASQLIANTEKLIPGLSKRIELQIESTPFTLKRYSLNSDGAAVGWSAHPGEAFKGGLKGIMGTANTPTENLYQVGHWAASPGGAPLGLITGKLVSSTIRRRLSQES